jgi:hypothetical protein
MTLAPCTFQLNANTRSESVPSPVAMPPRQHSQQQSQPHSSRVCAPGIWPTRRARLCCQLPSTGPLCLPVPPAPLGAWPLPFGRPRHHGVKVPARRATSADASNGFGSHPTGAERQVARGPTIILNMVGLSDSVLWRNSVAQGRLHILSSLSTAMFTLSRLLRMKNPASATSRTS